MLRISRTSTEGRTTLTLEGEINGRWVEELRSECDRTLDDTELAPETLQEARVQVRRSWPALDLGFGFGVGERTRGPISTDYADVHVSVSRQFR